MLGVITATRDFFFSTDDGGVSGAPDDCKSQTISSFECLYEQYLSRIAHWWWWWWWWWYRGGETKSLNYGHQGVYFSLPRCYMSMEKHGGMISAWENSWFVYQSFLAILPAEQSMRSWAKEMMNFALRNIPFIFRRVFSYAVNLKTWGRRLCFRSEGRRTVDFYHP
jgi:hypothetical protein